VAERKQRPSVLSCFHAAPHCGGEGGFWLRRHGGSGGGVFGVWPGHAFLPYILAGTEVCPDFPNGFDAAELASRLQNQLPRLPFVM
jgi:hypothetical protein